MGLPKASLPGFLQVVERAMHKSFTGIPTTSVESDCSFERVCIMTRSWKCPLG